jgi:excinuclease ABC subunit B
VWIFCTILRLGEFDVLVGVNLLREGLIFRKFLSLRSWTLTKRGSCARDFAHSDDWAGGAQRARAVILYAEVVTDSMARALAETQRRRQLQLEYNQKHGITPETVKKAIKEFMPELARERKEKRAAKVAAKTLLIWPSSLKNWSARCSRQPSA